MVFWFVVGYVTSVVFPLPWVQRAILDLWSKAFGVYESVRAKYLTNTTTTVTPVANTSSTSVNRAL
jgi:hypothetical protein